MNKPYLKTFSLRGLLIWVTVFSASLAFLQSSYGSPGSMGAYACALVGISLLAATVGAPIGHAFDGTEGIRTGAMAGALTGFGMGLGMAPMELALFFTVFMVYRLTSRRRRSR